MMEINKEAIDKLAHLSKIEIKKEEEQVIQERLQYMLNWINTLNDLDLTDVEPLRVMTFESQIAREDVAHNSLALPDALKIAPEIENNHFVVPKVIE